MELDAQGIEELLRPENIRIVEEVSSWEDAIRVACRPLVEGGYAEPHYAENIIKDTEELGPYYVLTEDVALIHARPEEGAIRKQMAVTLVRQPVVFSEESFPVRILFALAAEDADSHIEVIRMLANICMDEERVRQLAECATTAEAYRMLTSPEGR